MSLKYGIHCKLYQKLITPCIEQESEEVKKLFADIPDEDRRQIQKLSYKIAELADQKEKL